MPSNGCGPVWMPQWIKDVLFNWFFEASCNKHNDGCAYEGTEADRAACARKFLDAMLRGTDRQQGIKRLFALTCAYSFLRCREGIRMDGV